MRPAHVPVTRSNRVVVRMYELSGEAVPGGI